MNLNNHTSYFSHALNYSHEYVSFWYVWNIRTTNFEILIGSSFSQMSNFRRVKNSHVFVTPAKYSFEFFTCVTNTCEFFTRVTDSFECESPTNLSQVWKIRTYLKNSCEFFHRCNTYAWHMWQIHKKEYLYCVHIHFTAAYYYYHYYYYYFVLNN